MELIISKIVTSIFKDLAPAKNFKQIITVDGDNFFVGASNYNKNQFEKIHLVTIGKAAEYEIKSLYDIFTKLLPDKLGCTLCYGKNNTKYELPENIVTLKGSHPYLSKSNLKSTKAFCEKLATFNENDLCLISISGGTSALLEELPSSISFEIYDKVQNNLLHSGRNIEDINNIRKSLSLIKNGGLLTKIPCQNICALISCDDPSNKIENVGSSPLLYQKTKIAQLQKLIKSFNFDEAILEEFFDWIFSLENENLELKKRVLQAQKNVKFYISSNSSTLRKASLGVLEKYFSPHFINKDFPIYDIPLNEMIQEEVQRIKRSSEHVFISGGEASVKLPSKFGRGGRNTHFCAVMGKMLFDENIFDLTPSQLEQAWILSLATDGTDGPTDCAGSFYNFEVHSKSLNFNQAIQEFDTYSLLNKMGALIQIPTTGVNLMDLRIIYIPR